MSIDEMIAFWEEKHSLLLETYNSEDNSRVLQTYRSQMANMLDFINILKQTKNNDALEDKVFKLANELAGAGYGVAAVRMHEIHNNMHGFKNEVRVTNIPTMPIIHVTTPGFEYEGRPFTVQGRMYADLRSFQDDILRYQTEGYTKCFLYAILTGNGPNGIILYFVRCLFVK